MSKANEKDLLQSNATLPSGSKRRYVKSKSLKKKESATTAEKKPSKPYVIPAVAKPPEYDIPTAQNVVFQPNPGPQTEYLASGEREVLYGGAAGGGKSYATLADPLRNMNSPDFSGLLVRHTTEELRELIQKSQELYPKAIPGIKWSERKSQ